MIKPEIVIPAKGCSQRFPRKNLAIYRGKPLVQHSIEYAMSEGYVPHVLSEDSEILTLAEQLGAQTIKEPNWILKGHLCVAVKYAAAKLKAEYIINIPVASPVRPPGLIRRAIELLKDHDCVYAGVPLPGHFIRNRDGRLVNREYQANGEPPHSNTFKDDPQWIQSGIIMAYRTEPFLKQMDSVFSPAAVIEVGIEHLADIDWKEDLDAIQTV